MNSIIRLLLLVMCAVTSVQAATFYPVDSKKDIEVQISSLLKDKISVNTTLKVIDEKGDDLRVATLFSENKEKNIPKIAAFVDTRVINKDKTGSAISQVINIFSIAEIKLKTNDRLRLLEWANKWNSNILPIRIQVSKDAVIATINLVTTKANPLNSDVVISSYLSIIQVWPAIIQSLEKSNLLLK